ncbi:hypothetical protein FisN_3Hh006 [Fistulifera solaris]|uniref:Uncharacterized protein n=1 Tax=Fistulifera solaris TaxID=1519565 RepID=A0A1Z5K0J4_FISSO|nr:hypothetical protein FisN_3Hh006 [Fistulifera solaris]|eukprot:GAX19777.2 hypothetical protein FisN_3Hh006 [Fistulifera solaris]
MESRRKLPLEQLLAATKKQRKKSRENETQSTRSQSTAAGRSLASCPKSLPSRSLSLRPALPSRSVSSRSTDRIGVPRKVSFSEESHRTYSVPKMASSNAEKRALWFSKSEYKEMKNEMFEMAKMTKLDGRMDETSHFSYRGLERMLSNEGVSELAKQSILIHRDETMYALASARAVSEARQLAQTDADDAAAYLIESFSESFSQLVSMSSLGSESDQDDEENLSKFLPRQRSLTRKTSIRRIRQDPGDDRRSTDPAPKEDAQQLLPPQRSRSYTSSSSHVERRSDKTRRDLQRHQKDDNSCRSLPQPSLLSRKNSIRRGLKETDQNTIDPHKQSGLFKSASQPGSLRRTRSAHVKGSDPESLAHNLHNQSARFITVEAGRRDGGSPKLARSISCRRSVSIAQHVN